MTSARNYKAIGTFIRRGNALHGCLKLIIIFFFLFVKETVLKNARLIFLPFTCLVIVYSAWILFKENLINILDSWQEDAIRQCMYALTQLNFHLSKRVLIFRSQKHTHTYKEGLGKMGVGQALIQEQITLPFPKCIQITL